MQEVDRPSVAVRRSVRDRAGARPRAERWTPAEVDDALTQGHQGQSGSKKLNRPLNQLMIFAQSVLFLPHIPHR